MASKSSIQVRLDSSLKQEAESILENIGLDTSAAIRIFYRKIVATKSIPFALEDTSDYFSPEEEAEILKAASESESAENIVASTNTKAATKAFLESLG